MSRLEAMNNRQLNLNDGINEKELAKFSEKLRLLDCKNLSPQIWEILKKQLDDKLLEKINGKVDAKSLFKSAITDNILTGLLNIYGKRIGIIDQSEGIHSLNSIQKVCVFLAKSNEIYKKLILDDINEINNIKKIINVGNENSQQLFSIPRNKPTLSENTDPLNTNGSKQPEVNNRDNLNSCEQSDGISDKKLNKLNYNEAKSLFIRIFGDGPGTQLVDSKSNGNPTIFIRIIALAKHEGNLDFGRCNRDPNKRSRQFNIGTFQLSAKFGSSNIIDKYFGNMIIALEKTGFNLNNINTIITNYNNESRKANRENFGNIVIKLQTEIINCGINKTQQDLLAWMGFIYNERGGEDTINKLANPNLSNKEISRLMSRTIQGGISRIGIDVVKQINNNNGNNYV